MAHLLYSQQQDQPIKWFEKFDKEEIKTEKTKKDERLIQPPRRITSRSNSNNK